MQENKFEKQVQKKMEELSLTPSVPVWQNIEQQLKKRKERRRVILWLLPFMLLAGGIVWWQSGNQNKQLPHTATGMEQTPANDATATTRSAQTNHTPNQQQPNTTAAPRKKIIPNPSSEIPGVLQEQNTFEKVSATKKNQSFTSSATTSNKKVIAAKEKSDVVVASPVTPAPIEDVDKDVMEQADATNENKKVLERVLYQQANLSITAAGSGAVKETIATDPQQLKNLQASMETAVATNEIKKDGKWQWGVSSRVGVSGMANGVFTSGANTFQDRFAASPNTNTGGSFWSPSAVPSEIKSNLSFNIGATLKRKWGKRSFITTGLQYSYYSTQLSVGTRGTNDTLITFSAGGLRTDRYYRNNGSFNQYNNRYHHIEIPVGFEYQLFQNLPLHIQHGISVSRLLASNALHYNADANIYYRAKDVLRKEGINLFTTIDYRLMQKDAFSLYAGPQMQYSISKLYRDGTPGNQHLRFIGLNTRVTF